MRRLLLILALSLVSLGTTGHAGAQQAGVTRHFPAGWNLIAMPSLYVYPGIDVVYTLQPGDSNYQAIILGQGTRRGFGYWAHVTMDEDVPLTAGSDLPYRVTAPSGQYIMVGNPSGRFPATVSGADVVYAYDPATGYLATSSLQPGQGAWAFSSTGGPATISLNRAASAP
ncbi:MAG: hypothetical protein ACR2PL_19550 [Dehalococcoidia bacterium]